MPCPDEVHNVIRAIGIREVCRVEQQIGAGGMTDDAVEMIDQLVMILLGHIHCPNFIDQRMELRRGVIVKFGFKVHLKFILVLTTNEARLLDSSEQAVINTL
jgi:hypothetical protein